MDGDEERLFRDVLEVDECIQLHNEVIELACRAVPDLRSQVRRNVFSLGPHRIPVEDALVQQTEDNMLNHDQWKEHLGEPMTRFLENIDVFTGTETKLKPCNTFPFNVASGCSYSEGNHLVQTMGELMHPLARCPCLYAFRYFADFLENDETINGSVLLYHEREFGNTGGVFVDLSNDYWVSWIHIIGIGKEDRKNWHVLDAVLRRWKTMWEVGKFRAFDSVRDPDYTRFAQFALVPWVERDVERTVEAWERLLNVLRRRISTFEDHAEQPLASAQQETMVSDSLLAAWQFPSFGRQFFRKATAPPANVKFIAPGITYMTDELFEEIQRGPRTGSSMQLVSMGGSSTQPMLMFPAASSEPRIVDWDTKHQSFNLPWAFAQDKRAGVYIDTVHNTWGDGAQFVNILGQNKFFNKQGAVCPWAAGTRPIVVLSEILDAFSALLDNGVWDVNHDGVMGGIQWWNREATNDNERIDECLRGNWFTAEY